MNLSSIGINWLNFIQVLPREQSFFTLNLLKYTQKFTFRRGLDSVWLTDIIDHHLTIAIHQFRLLMFDKKSMEHYQRNMKLKQPNNKENKNTNFLFDSKLQTVCLVN